LPKLLKKEFFLLILTTVLLQCVHVLKIFPIRVIIQISTTFVDVQSDSKSTSMTLT